MKGADMVGRLPEPLWDAIVAALPYVERNSIDDRRVIEAVVFVLRSGAHWHNLKATNGVPSCSTVSRRVRLWHKARVWLTIEELLRTQLPDGQQLPWHRLGLPHVTPPQGPHSARHTMTEHRSGGARCEP